MNVADLAFDAGEMRARGASEPGSLVRRGDQLMVFVTASRFAPELLRAGAEAAGRLRSSWYAVYVEPSGRSTDAGARHGGSELRKTVSLAETFGATVVRVTASDPVEGLIAFARREGIRHVIFEASADPRATKASRSIRDRFLSEMSSVTVHEMHAGGLVVVSLEAVKSPGEYGTPSRWLWIWFALFGLLVILHAPGILWLAVAVVLSVLWCRSLEGL